MHSIVYDIFSR